MLRTFSLTMTFGNRTLWQDLDLEFGGATMTALVGPSGSGKSTLLNCLGLLIEPSSGRVELDGRDLTALGPGAARRFRRDELGYLFQSYALIEDATIRDNLAVVSRRSGRPAATRQLMEQALERVGLAGQLDTTIARLSGGEQQRVALARLLLKKPRLVLADEPTGALDQDNTASVISMLRSLADDGACVLIATHDTWVRDQCDADIRLGEDAAVRPPRPLPKIQQSPAPVLANS